MIRIGILVYDVSLVGGAEHVALKMAEEFKADYDVHMISLFAEKQIPHIDHAHIFTVNKVPKKIPFHFLSLKSKLRHYLLEQNIDILFSITAGVVTLASEAVRGTKIRMVYCEHSNLENQTYGKKHLFRQKYGAKHADCVVTLTNRDRDNFIRIFHTPADRVVAIPNWADSQESLQDYNPSSKRIISAGRLEQVKGYDMLVQAAQLVYSRHPDWHWDIYGEGSYHQTIQSDIDAHGLHDFLTLQGNVSDLPQRFPQYAFFVMTSYYEGLPLVLLEAQGGWLPIVSFDSPTGPSEIISHEHNGFLVPCYDVNQLADKVCALIEDKDLRMCFSEHAQDNLAHFSKKCVLQQWYSLIQRLA